MNLASVVLSLSLVASGASSSLRLLAHPIAAAGQSEPESKAQGPEAKPQEPESKPQEPAKPQEPEPSAETPKPTVPETAPVVTPPTEGGTSTSPISNSGATKSCRKSKSGKCLKRSAATGKPRKVVVRNGGTSEPIVKLGPTVPSKIASQQAQVTEQLLSSAESNLKQASTRQLNADQAAVAEQIRNYIEQARAAAKSGDGQRGHNLAVKARLLSDDLVAH